MGVIRDTLRGASETMSRVASEVAREPFDRLDSWATRRKAERRLSEIDDQIEKAARKATSESLKEPGRDPKAIDFDPFQLSAAMGWKERPSRLTFSAMERTAETVPTLADIILARVTQTQQFMTPPETRYDSGFEVRHKDKKKRKQPAVKKRCEELTKDLMNCGYRTRDGNPQDETTFREFGGMLIRDSLTFDQATFEIVPDRAGKPCYFAIVDPATIRLVDRAARRPEDPFAVQLVNDMVVADFLPKELAFCVRNPRSGIGMQGYGRSEIETLIKEVTGFLWGIEYNQRFFSQGSAAKGILNFKGTVPDKHLKSFRRQWYSMISGVHNSWRTPITNAEELQWISLQMSSKDMEMAAFLDFLIKIICARYLIAPEEVNFSYGNSGQSQAMGQAPIEEKLKASKDLGLRPLVWWFFGCINKFWMSQVDNDYEAVPVGLDEKGAEAETALLKEQTAVYLTVDEARDELGLEPLPDGKGECLRDPTWLQFAQGLEGMGDEEGDNFGEDDEGEEDAASDDDLDDEDVDVDDYGFEGDDEVDAEHKAIGTPKPETTEKSMVRYEITL